jgi:cell division protein FtsI/penicillin-binding protein 2
MKDALTARLYILVIILSVVGGLIIFQMGRVQLSPGGQALRDKLGPGYEYQNVHITPERGNIYDRWANLLAGNKEMYEVGINYHNANLDPKTIAEKLSEVLGLDYNYVLEKATQKNQSYVVVKNFVESEQIAQIKMIQEDYQNHPAKRRLGRDEIPPNIDAVEWTPHLVRTYPENTLGANVLGFYSFMEREQGKAYFGVEQKYDNILAGNAIDMLVPVNPSSVQKMPDLPPGSNLILTIDREIQLSMEDVIQRAVKHWGADAGTIIVVDPKTGEILAMATTPSLDLNKYWEYQDIFPGQTPFNRAISQTYEPGSVFKILTMASAIDAGKVNPDTQFIDTGSISIGGITIYNWDRGAWGPQTMIGCMQHSLNVCLTWVAQQLGPALFYKYMDAFGIGHRTKIDLAGEVNFPLSAPGDSTWSDANLGTNSFGQGLAVTPIQFVTAASALANDGKMMAPHILKAVSENGRQRFTQPVLVSQPISAESAHTITEMLAVSLEKEASDAMVPGYRLAGKTGTGEIPTETGYSSNLTNASFVGWGPTDDPRFLVFVWLEKPKSSPWGSIVAAPVFSEAVQKLVVLMNLPPDEIRQQLYSK